MYKRLMNRLTREVKFKVYVGNLPKTHPLRNKPGVSLHDEYKLTWDELTMVERLPVVGALFLLLALFAMLATIAVYIAVAQTTFFLAVTAILALALAFAKWG